MRFTQSDFNQRVESRVEVWPCSLWKHEWMYEFSPDELGSGELLSLSHGDVVAAAHRAILRAGATALVTNTFGATAVVMEGYGAANKASAVNRESARLATEVSREVSVTEYQPIVVGSMGPTCNLLSLDQAKYGVMVETMTSSYLDQAQALWEGGVNAFHLERCQDPLNAQAALVALTRLEDRIASPLTKVVTAQIEQTGSMVLGTSVKAFWNMIRPSRPQAFGVVGRLEVVEECVASLVEVVDVPLIAMVDAFAIASPEGWLQSPSSLAVGLAGLVDRYKIKIAGVGVEAEPEFILSLAEKLR